jgi:hypothetical protein
MVKEYGNIAVTAIRGGEPSTHPNLPALIRVADKYSGKVYIETHGRWLDPAISTTHAEAILDACRDTDATLKISFDRMHGLSSTRLRIILDHVESNRVRWCVAVTEDSIADACEFLAGVSWLTVDNIFLQIKAKRAADLVKPRMAVIASDGTISLTVSSRWQEHSDILETTV